MSAPSPLEAREAAVEAETRDYTEFEKQKLAFQQAEFVRKYNELVRAITAFSITYNEKHVVNVKEIKALRDALKNLEKSDAWLKASSKQ